MKKLPAPGRGARVHVTVSQEAYKKIAALASIRRELPATTMRAILEAEADAYLRDCGNREGEGL